MTQQTKNTFNRPNLGNSSVKTEPKTFNIKITFTTIITVTVLFLIGFGWSFVLGVMVGRDYDPQNIIHEISSGLPSENEQEELSDNAMQSNAETIQSNKSDTQGTDPLIADEKNQIIKIEELNFSSSLKGKPGQGKLEPEPINKEQKNAQVTTNTTLIKVSTDIKVSEDINGQAINKPVATSEDKSSSSIPSTKTKKPKQEVAVQQQDEPKKKIYDFLMQVATLTNIEAVDKLRADLEGRNLRTRMDKWQGTKGELYTVFVVFRGTEVKALELYKTFRRMNLGPAIQKEKKLVAD